MIYFLQVALVHVDFDTVSNLLFKTSSNASQEIPKDCQRSSVWWNKHNCNLDCQSGKNKQTKLT